MDKKIKIAEVITRLDWGGSPDIVRLICSSYNPDKFDIKLITGFSEHLSLETRKFLNTFEKNTYYIPHLKRDVNPIDEILTFWKLYKLFRKGKFDIVHTHTAKAGVLGRVAAWCANVPYIIHTSHGHNFYGYFGPVASRMVVILERFLTCMTDEIVTLTELEKKDLIDFKVSKPEKILVINSGIDLDRYKNTRIDKGKIRRNLAIGDTELVVGLIGRLESIKCPEYFISAAERVSGKIPNVKFLIVGEGSLRKKLEQMARELQIYDKTIFLGWREDVPEILPVLDMLVLPSLNEAVGRVLIEAGACGVPSVATSVGGIPEIIRDNETGILVPPESIEDLAQAIISLLENTEKRKEMGNNAKNWINDKFTSKKMVDEIYKLYGSLIKNEKL